MQIAGRLTRGGDGGKRHLRQRQHNAFAKYTPYALFAV
jgi:hypothetical protein